MFGRCTKRLCCTLKKEKKMPKIIGALRDLALDKYKKEFDPETYYHGSTKTDIEEFKGGEEFMHFGSPKAAQQRLEHKRFTNNSSTGAIYPVKLRATKPLLLKEQKFIGGFYKWDPWNIERIWERIASDIGIAGVTPPSKKKKLIAKEKYYISLEELNTAKEDGKFWKENFEFDGVPFGKADELYEGGKKQWLIDFLESKGYDSIEYVNRNEDPGSISKIVFKPEQVRSKFAKFDPSKRQSGKILASTAGAGALGTLPEGEQ